MTPNEPGVGAPRVAMELTREEVGILLRWAEQATRGLYPSRDRYLGETEARLLARLEELAAQNRPPESEG